MVHAPSLASRFLITLLVSAVLPLLLYGWFSLRGMREQIDEQVAYLRFIQEVARKGFDAGKTPLEAATAADLGRFAALLDAERLVGNLHRAYSEIRGEPLGTTLDLPMVVADMITLNGGKPVRCVA